jgi:hypothetical protein
MKILVLNSGSSSQKSCLYEIGDSVPNDRPPCQWEDKIEWDDEVTEIALKNVKGAVRKERTKVGSRAEAVGNCSPIFGRVTLGPFPHLPKLMLLDTASFTMVLTTKIPYWSRRK